ncbi:MAG: M28 family peptidase, partial [Candidatus Lokiarchaeota archaeon]|nr:M28 family peptidase [Candidatus Lokiarchaeota archaeon]
VIDNIGPRYAGSKEEALAAEDLNSRLSEFSDDIMNDKFEVFPDLYPQGLIKIAVIMAIFSSLFFTMTSPINLIAPLGYTLGLIVFFSSLFLMKEWFAFPFKKAKSTNVVGKIKPRINNESINGKKKIIIAGHLDSANEMNIVKLGDLIGTVSIIGAVWIVISIILAILKSILVWLAPSIVLGQWFIFQFSYIDLIWVITACAGIPLLLYLEYAYTGDEVVPGANDNLISIGIALALGKYFSQEENRLHNVELWVGGFGSEECGERGSCAFVKEYGPKGELDNALAVIPESCGAGSNLAILTRERMHLAHHNIELCNKVFEGYKKYKEEYGDGALPCKVCELPYSASDAGRFSLKGYKATTILGYMGKLMKPINWHQTNDSYESLEMKTINAVIEIYKNFIRIVEKELEE